MQQCGEMKHDVGAIGRGAQAFSIRECSANDVDRRRQRAIGRALPREHPNREPPLLQLPDDRRTDRAGRTGDEREPPGHQAVPLREICTCCEAHFARVYDEETSH